LRHTAGHQHGGHGGGHRGGLQQGALGAAAGVRILHGLSPETHGITTTSAEHLPLRAALIGHGEGMGDRNFVPKLDFAAPCGNPRSVRFRVQDMANFWAVQGKFVLGTLAGTHRNGAVGRLCKKATP
jgi:hypothetical protein